MLQIVTGRFFRDVELTTTRQRGVLYTNYRMGLGSVETISGTLQPAESWRDLETVVYEVDQRLEALAPDGRRECLIAEPAEFLISDFAVVTSFALGVTCTPDFDLALRLTQARHPTAGIPRLPRQYVRRVFDDKVEYAPGDDVRLQAFVRDLTALERRKFKTAMQAMRRYVVGLHRIADDLDLAYTLFVASMESLAQAFDAFTPSWNDLSEDRRRRIDRELGDVDAAIADRVRMAIIENEHLALGRRFREFVMANLADSYFREDALLEERPIRKSDLPGALKTAYQFRSGTVHTLTALPRQITSLPSLWDTAVVDDQVVLSLHGVARLARHVIGQFIARCPKVEKEQYDYRRDLPNVVWVQLAERYWLGKRDSYGAKTANTYLNGFLNELTRAMAGQNTDRLTDLTPIMEEIESQVKGLSQAKQRLPMLALYVLFNAVVPAESRRPGIDRLLETYRDDFDLSSPEAMLVRVLGEWDGRIWGSSDFAQAWEAYGRQRARKGGLSFGAVLDAAALLTWADSCRDEGEIGRVRELVTMAVEELPGNEKLLGLEASVRLSDEESVPTVNWRDILLPSRSECVTRKDMESEGQAGK